MLENQSKKRKLSGFILKFLVTGALLSAFLGGVEIILGRSFDTQSLLDEHDKINNLRNLLNNNQMLTQTQRRFYQKSLDSMVESHITYQKVPFQGLFYKYFPYTPKCPLCVQLRSNNQKER